MPCAPDIQRKLRRKPDAAYLFRTNNFPGNCLINRFISRLNSVAFTAELGNPLPRMISSTPSHSLAPFLMRSWQPLLRGESMMKQHSTLLFGLQNANLLLRRQKQAIDEGG